MKRLPLGAVPPRQNRVAVAPTGLNQGLLVLQTRLLKSGKRIRGHFVVNSVDDKGDGRFAVNQDVTIEIEGEDKPALAAEWITMVWM